MSRPQLFDSAINRIEVTVINHQHLVTSLTGIILLSLCLLTISAMNEADAQQPRQAVSEETARAIQLYQQGDNKAAVKVLRDATKKNKTDAEAWRYFGLILLQDGKEKDAGKAFESSIRLRPDNVSAQIGIACALLRSDRSEGAVRETERAARKAGFKRFSEAVDELEKFFQLSPKQLARSTRLWHEQLEMLKLYANYADKANPDREVFDLSEVTVKPIVISREVARYTDQARQNKTQGVVVISGILDKTGKMRYPIVVQSLPDGLTEAALNATSRMRWKPAEKNGKPVAVILSNIDFTFNIY